MTTSTWLDQRAAWEYRQHIEALELKRLASLPKADKELDYSPAWDNPPLPSERCDWSDLHVIACGHCQGTDSDDIPSGFHLKYN